MWARLSNCQRCHACLPRIPTLDRLQHRWQKKGNKPSNLLATRLLNPTAELPLPCRPLRRPMPWPIYRLGLAILASLQSALNFLTPAPLRCVFLLSSCCVHRHHQWRKKCLCVLYPRISTNPRLSGACIFKFLLQSSSSSVTCLLYPQISPSMTVLRVLELVHETKITIHQCGISMCIPRLRAPDIVRNLDHRAVILFHPWHACCDRRTDGWLTTFAAHAPPDGPPTVADLATWCCILSQESTGRACVH
jgi:hypothetical protein